jgi:Fic-DOC domain mobile mystery protein B
MPFGPTIPGATPIDDTSGLKIPHITTLAELSVFEAENIAKAHLKYLAGSVTRKSAKFDYAWCLKLHREMFGDVWEWAGTLRTHNPNIWIPFAAIPESLAMLLADLESWSGFGHAMDEQSAWLHHRAVKIHPFKNGNGRWSRMLANVWLKLHKQPLVEWPENIIGTESEIRAAYIAAIKKADAGEYDDLIAIHRRYTAKPGS